MMRAAGRLSYAYPTAQMRISDAEYPINVPSQGHSVGPWVGGTRPAPQAGTDSVQPVAIEDVQVPRLEGQVVGACVRPASRALIAMHMDSNRVG